ncbi:hypothetical protein P5673_025054, partial [Acropora cervicornis]
IKKKAQKRAIHKKTPGQKRKELDNKVYTLSITRRELESVQSLKSEAISINKDSEERMVAKAVFLCSLLCRPLQLYQQVCIALPRGSCWAEQESLFHPPGEQPKP